MIIDSIALPNLGASSVSDVRSQGLRDMASAAAAGADFSAVLGDLAANAIGTLKAADAASIAAVQGEASVQQVVDAVMSAEQTLQASIAIRDKIVSAYIEMTRMQI